MNLTDEEKEKLAVEWFNGQSFEYLATISLLRIAEMAIDMNSEKTSIECEAVIDGKEYKCKMLVTYKQL